MKLFQSSKLVKVEKNEIYETFRGNKYNWANFNSEIVVNRSIASVYGRFILEFSRK